MPLWGNAALAMRSSAPKRNPFLGLPEPPPGVRPTTDRVKPGMAMDDALTAPIGGAWGAWAQQGMWGEGLWFPGYAYLAELAQRPEYRNIVETVAEEMTRKWVKIVTSGDTDKTEKIKAIEAAMKLIGLRESFNRAMELEGFMGMGMLYVDLVGPGDVPVSDDPAELGMELALNPGKIELGSLRGFVPVDPTWVSPVQYNSIDPLKPDYFRPYLWYVMGKKVHASRLLIVRSREIPDILKAAYNFGGLSLSQISKPYVDNWLRTRQSVSDLIHAFTTFVLKTNMNNLLANTEVMRERVEAFVLGRDNKGLMLIDKEIEEFENVSAPLGGLDSLQAQSMEQMAFPAQLTLLKMFGYTPKGLNASSDGEIRTGYDRIKAKQEKTFGHILTTALQIIQLSEFGSIDPEIGFEFVALWELDDAGRAAVEKTKADTDAVYMAGAVISNEEVRTRVAGDPESPYHGLEGPAPEPIAEESAENDSDDPTDKIDRGGAEGSESEANSGV